MSHHHQTEFLTHERQQKLLAEAEQERLYKLLPVQPHSQIQRIAVWVGSQLVKWGTKLQGSIQNSAPSAPTDLLPE